MHTDGDGSPMTLSDGNARRYGEGSKDGPEVGYEPSSGPEHHPLSATDGRGYLDSC